MPYFFTKNCAALIRVLPLAIAFGAAGALAADKHEHEHEHEELAPSAGTLADDSLYHLESVWVDESGHTDTLKRFAGKPAVLAMIYTSCEYACPLIIGDMMKIYDALPPDDRAQTQFILVSFDPARDTPDVMHTYKKKNLPVRGWNLISANDGDTLEFAVATGIRYKPAAGGEFSHSNVVMVLDREGREVFRQSGIGNPPDNALTSLLEALDT